jgi:hypothetical protein
MRIAAAAVLYFLIVFGVGFVLGPVRVLWLEPRLGETAAVLCEAPFLFAAIVFAARWIAKYLRLRANFRALLGMGLGALALQQLADFALASWLRGMMPAEEIARLATPAGLICLALLIVFAAMPVLANWSRRQPAQSPFAQARSTSLRAVKAIHTLVWAFFAGCILAIPVAAWRGQFRTVVVLAMVVLLEIGVLFANGWRCPLTNVAARYTDDRADNFDIYLPLWLARHNKLIFGWLFVATLVFALLLWLWR